MEGSQRPASFGQLDSSVVNGSGPGAMASVPAPGTPVSGGGAMPPQAMPTPGPAATAMAQPQMPMPPTPPPVYNPMPPGIPELNEPAESVLLTELQELKAAAQAAIKLNRIYALLLLGAGMAMIYYIGSNVKAKVNAE